MTEIAGHAAENAHAGACNSRNARAGQARFGGLAVFSADCYGGKTPDSELDATPPRMISTGQPAPAPSAEANAPGVK